MSLSNAAGSDLDALARIVAALNQAASQQDWQGVENLLQQFNSMLLPASRRFKTSDSARLKSILNQFNQAMAATSERRDEIGRLAKALSTTS